MSVINRTMKTLNVPNGDDTICYEITDEQARNGLAGKADKVSGGTAGNLASVGSGGSLEDSGKKAADFLPASEKGEANGVAELDGTGRVPASQLPGYVDDVVEGYLYEGSFYEDTGHSILIQPESGKIYVDKETNKTYRWSGSAYVTIASDLALGETDSTADRGDRGKAAYDHATDPSRMSSATANGFFKVGVTAQGHVSSLIQVSKQDVTNLGVAPAQDPVFTGSITASGNFSHAEGYMTTATGQNCHAEGYMTSAINNNSHAEGSGSLASNTNAHAEGQVSFARGVGSHAEGYNTSAGGNYSHAEGYRTGTEGNNAHSEGNNTIASGLQSHSEGYDTTASGANAHAEGVSTTADGIISHAEGYGTSTQGAYSHAEGNSTVANKVSQHVDGAFNVVDDYEGEQGKGKYIAITGNGTASDARSNARALDWSGNEYLKGDLYVNCNDDSTGGKKVIPLPAVPTEDGTYILKCTVANGVASYSWDSVTA